MIYKDGNLEKWSGRRVFDDRLLLSSRLLLAQEFPNIVLFLVDDMGVMDTFLPFFDG